MAQNRRSIALAAVLLVMLALPFLAKAIGQPALVGLATRIMIYGIAAASLNLVLGFGGMVSFGHAAFFGIGGYVVAILFHHFRFSETLFGLMLGTDQFLLSVPAAMLVAAGFAAAIGALALRTSGVQFIMITLAFAQMLFFLFVALKKYGGDDGLMIRRRNAFPGLDLRDDVTFYFVVLTALALVLALIWRIVNSRFGMVLGGIRQNERRMAAIGISAYRYKLAAFVIAGALAGLAGALQANYARFASPDMMHWTKSGELMIMVILGGVGTLFGPLIGAAALVSLETVLTAYTEHWQLVLGPLLVAIILVSRGGLAGLARLFRREGPA
jgi:branched-chain amino acid transport system permease protein